MRLIDADALIKRLDANEYGMKLPKAVVGMTKALLDDAPTIDIPTWIPCTERLPKLGEKVLASTRKTCFVQVYKGIYSEPTRWAWEHRSIKKIIAWMPLPEPYKETDDE